MELQSNENISNVYRLKMSRPPSQTQPPIFSLQKALLKNPCCVKSQGLASRTFEAKLFGEKR